MKATKGGNCKGQSWLSCVNPSLTMLFLFSRLKKRGLSSCLSMLMTVCAGLGTWPSSGQSLGLEKMGCRWFLEGCGGGLSGKQLAVRHPSIPPPHFLFFLSITPQNSVGCRQLMLSWDCLLLGRCCHCHLRGLRLSILTVLWVVTSYTHSLISAEQGLLRPLGTMGDIRHCPGSTGPLRCSVLICLGCWTLGHSSFFF